MSGGNGDATRIVVVEGDLEHDVLEVLGVDDDVLRVRSPLLFEIGEELSLRITDHAGTRTKQARIVGHSGPSTATVTELVLLAD